MRWSKHPILIREETVFVKIRHHISFLLIHVGVVLFFIVCLNREINVEEEKTWKILLYDDGGYTYYIYLIVVMSCDGNGCWLSLL